MSNQDPSPAESLQSRFRKELKKPVLERYFSETDLVAVFDAAGDNYDDYLRAEALLLGSRLYPDSVSLMERRAIFYLDTDRELFVNFMSDLQDVSSNILKILRLNLLEGQDKKFIEQQVNDFIRDYNFDEDEEVIQFVQTVHSLDLDQWLVDNLPILKKKVQYLPSLLYEYAVNAEESAILAGVAIEVLEELTEIEPYVVDYWNMLAIAYIASDRASDAYNAVEYSLAIDPDNIHALKTRLHIANIKGDHTEFMDTLWKLNRLEPTDTDVASLAVLSFADDEKEVLFEYLDLLSPECRSARTVIFKAISSGYPRLEQLLTELFDFGVKSREDWFEMADAAYSSENHMAVNLIFRIFEEKSGNPLNHDFLMFRILFDMEKYDVASSLFVDSDNQGTLRRPENLYTGYSMFLVSLLRMGDFVSARNAAKSLLDMFSGESEMIGSKIEQIAVTNFLKDILKRLDSKRKTDWNKYLPLV